ncbi:MAG: UDP-N-acetylglucosamine 2-epimerase (hydrolyzing) [Pseudodesulfovibrio sp.]|nr:UDP-N-acetylglucosamine 2-epimerase (hydrolyzing) [Pseudodesulfovibrio sp.]
MKICIFTGTRAEYGLLTPLMRRIDSDPDLDLLLLVTGSHLSERHGKTIDTIIADGFTVHAQVPLHLNDDSPLGITKALGEAVSGCATALDNLRPDMLVLLGDRYECLACAMAAAMMHVPVAHIHGGEVTEGAVDDYFRHAITKMAHLHFASCEQYRKRIIQLGERPETAFNVGALGVENIHDLQLMDKTALEASLDFQMGDACLLATFHPVTLDADIQKQFKAFFNGLNSIMDSHPDVRIIITGANADPGGSTIDALTAKLAHGNNRVFASQSLGQLRYLSAMKFCAATIGNSSSGIIETPSFGLPTVNIGDRQKGRVQAKSIINCPADEKSIISAIESALSAAQADVAKNIRNPYEKPNTSRHILDIIKQFSFDLKKPFFDIPFQSSQDNGEED